MGNAESSETRIDKDFLSRKALKFKEKKSKNTFCEEKAIQCAILIPPSPRDIARQTASYSVKITQVGSRPCLQNRSTLTDIDFNVLRRHLKVPSRKFSPCAKSCGCRHVQEEKPRNPSSAPINFQEYYQPYPDVVPGACVYTTKHPSPYDMPRMRPVFPNWMCQSSRIPSFPYYPPQTASPVKVEAGDNAWASMQPFPSFEPIKQVPVFRQPHVQIVEKPEIIPPTAYQEASNSTLRRARSWTSIFERKTDESSKVTGPHQTISMENLRHSVQQQRRCESLNPPSRSQIRTSINTEPSPSLGIPNYPLVADSNQSNQAFFERMYASTEYLPFYSPYFCGPRSSPIYPAFSMANLAPHVVPNMSHLSRANSMRGIKTGLMFPEPDRRLQNRLNLTNCSNNSGWSHPPSPVRGGATRNVGPLGDTIERTPRGPPRQKTAAFGHPTKFRFYLKESPRVTKILLDTEDRRIRTICDRFQCDLEVYSKVPKSGFLQYAIDITAPDSSSLVACSRTLDSALGWFLTAQLAAARFSKY